MENGNKNKIIIVIILAVIFGLAGGIVSELVARAYILENNLNIPLFGEVDFSQNLNGGSSLVIRDARKVVVEQDAKINETAVAVGSSLVGIFQKIVVATGTAQTKNTVNDLRKTSYMLDNEIAAGFIITSDGWLVTEYWPEELRGGNTANQAKKNNAVASLAARYVVIGHDKKIYDVDDIVYDPATAYAFWHVKAVDLPVRKFVLPQEIENGQTVMAVTWSNWVWPTSIVGRDNGVTDLVRSSDLADNRLVLAQAPEEKFRGSFLFNLGGDLVGTINTEGTVNSVENYQPVITSLLKFKAINRSSLGLNYVDLARLIPVLPGQAGNGALVAKNKDGIVFLKGGVAEKTGLKEGDIITAVNMVELDKNSGLNDKISGFLPADKITISYLRNGIKNNIQVTLGELK